MKAEFQKDRNTLIITINTMKLFRQQIILWNTVNHSLKHVYFNLLTFIFKMSPRLKDISPGFNDKVNNWHKAKTAATDRLNTELIMNW